MIMYLFNNEIQSVSDLSQYISYRLQLNFSIKIGFY